MTTKLTELCKVKGWTIIKVYPNEVITLEAGWPSSNGYRILDASWLYNCLGINPDGTTAPDLRGD